MIILLTVFFPICAGVLLLVHSITEEPNGDFSDASGKIIPRKSICIYTAICLLISFGLILFTVSQGEIFDVQAIVFTDTLTISFSQDYIGRVFALVLSIVWLCVGAFSFEYMKHEKNNKRFFGTYIALLGVLMGLCFADNLFTYYAFYEFMTLGSFAMVLHNQSHEAVMAGLKYMFYSFAGAYMVLFGLFFVHKNTHVTAMTFSLGGIVIESNLVLQIAILLMIVGFSVKAGMFPMHSWLPSGHSVAPAPASAVLSAVIVKVGVLGIIRVIYYIFGREPFLNSFISRIAMALSLVTVLMGSMMAYKEKLLKRRLAYSTVSQVSYILFGLFMVDGTALMGSVVHVAAHAFIKSALFLCAGAIIYLTGATRVDELKGIGKKMPVLMWCYTIVSLGLIGIPPFGGFASKWYLCMGALKSGISFYSWFGPVVLLISALLTAGYLLPISINAFLPGKDYEKEAANEENHEYKAYRNFKKPSKLLVIPIVILTVMSVLIGMFPEVLLWV